MHFKVFQSDFVELGTVACSMMGSFIPFVLLSQKPQIGQFTSNSRRPGSRAGRFGDFDESLPTGS